MSVQSAPLPGIDLDNNYALLKAKLHPYCFGHSKQSPELLAGHSHWCDWQKLINGIFSNQATKHKDHSIDAFDRAAAPDSPQWHVEFSHPGKEPNAHLAGVLKTARFNAQYQSSLKRSFDNFVLVIQDNSTIENKLKPTAIQVKMLAELLFLGCIELPTTLLRCKDRPHRIILTPRTSTLYFKKPWRDLRNKLEEKGEKRWARSFYCFYKLLVKDYLHYQHGFMGTTRLKLLYPTDLNAQSAILRVELKSCLSAVARAVLEIGICCLALYTLPILFTWPAFFMITVNTVKTCMMLNLFRLSLQGKIIHPQYKPTI